MEKLLSTTRPTLLKFKTPEDLNNFRIECDCYTSYIEKDPNTLFGTFSQNQLSISVNTYNAIVSIEPDHHSFRPVLQYARKNLYGLRK